ncbi:hypothetical protein FQA39_LY17295 [Lamprigera yunnana]|nr:hypothetical protein FQA39_LY17295 [Lamprigera yunnana]
MGAIMRERRAFRDILNRTAEIKSTAAITAKFSEDNLFKLEVIAYIRLLIDHILEKAKKVEYGAKKDRAGDGGSASGDGERKGGEEGERGPNEMDATNKAYVDSAIQDSKTCMRIYMDILARNSEAAMRTHYTAYFDNTNAKMGKIVEKINSVHYAVECDINGIIANTIPLMVKTMVLELVRKNEIAHSGFKDKIR